MTRTQCSRWYRRICTAGISVVALTAVGLMVPGCESVAEGEGAPETASLDRPFLSQHGEVIDAYDREQAGFQTYTYGQERTIYRTEPYQEKGYQRTTYQTEAQRPLAGQQFQGQLANLRQVNTEPIVIADVRSGQTIPVVLGTASEVEKLNLQEGQQVRVEGNIRQMNGRSVLMARDVKASTGEQAWETAAAGEHRTISGTILGTHEVQGEAVWVADLQSGKTVAVNLGPRSEVNKLDLAQGKRIQATGAIQTSDGQTFLMADRVTFNGQSMAIDRSRQSIITQLEGGEAMGIERNLEQPQQQWQTQQPQRQATPAKALGGPIEVTLSSDNLIMPQAIKAGQSSFRLHNTSNDQVTFRIEGANLTRPISIDVDPDQTRNVQLNLQPGQYKVFQLQQGKVLTLTVTE